jgi:hypothetical protein
MTNPFPNTLHEGIFFLLGFQIRDDHTWREPITNKSIELIGIIPVTIDYQ